MVFAVAEVAGESEDSEAAFTFVNPLPLFVQLAAPDAAIPVANDPAAH
jgi:hypothetical protein